MAHNKKCEANVFAVRVSQFDVNNTILLLNLMEVFFGIKETFLICTPRQEGVMPAHIYAYIIGPTKIV